jgi:hypothetical protein
LQDFVHSLGTQSSLDEVSYSDSAYKGGQTGILALFLCDIVGEDLRGVVVRLEGVSKTVRDSERKQRQTIVAMYVKYVDEEGTNCLELWLLLPHNFQVGPPLSVMLRLGVATESLRRPD